MEETRKRFKDLNSWHLRLPFLFKRLPFGGYPILITPQGNRLILDLLADVLELLLIDAPDSSTTSEPEEKKQKIGDKIEMQRVAERMRNNGRITGMLLSLGVHRCEKAVQQFGQKSNVEEDDDEGEEEINEDDININRDPDSIAAGLEMPVRYVEEICKKEGITMDKEAAVYVTAGIEGISYELLELIRKIALNDNKSRQRKWKHSSIDCERHQRVTPSMIRDVIEADLELATLWESSPALMATSGRLKSLLTICADMLIKNGADYHALDLSDDLLRAIETRDEGWRVGQLLKRIENFFPTMQRDPVSEETLKNTEAELRIQKGMPIALRKFYEWSNGTPKEATHLSSFLDIGPIDHLPNLWGLADSEADWWLDVMANCKLLPINEGYRGNQFIDLHEGTIIDIHAEDEGDFTVLSTGIEASLQAYVSALEEQRRQQSFEENAKEKEEKQDSGWIGPAPKDAYVAPLREYDPSLFVLAWENSYWGKLAGY